MYARKFELVLIMVEVVTLRIDDSGGVDVGGFGIGVGGEF